MHHTLNQMQAQTNLEVFSSDVKTASLAVDLISKDKEFESETVTPEFTVSLRNTEQ